MKHFAHTQARNYSYPSQHSSLSCLALNALYSTLPLSLFRQESLLQESFTPITALIVLPKCPTGRIKTKCPRLILSPDGPTASNSLLPYPWPAWEIAHPVSSIIHPTTQRSSSTALLSKSLPQRVAALILLCYSSRPTQINFFSSSLSVLHLSALKPPTTQ